MATATKLPFTLGKNQVNIGTLDKPNIIGTPDTIAPPKSPVSDTGTITTPPPPVKSASDKTIDDSNSTVTASKKSLTTLEQQQDDAYNTFANTAKAYSRGSIPLSAGQQAQIDGLKQQYQSLIDSQKQTNIGATGDANIRGYQTGAGEYDPMFQAKTIGSIFTAGQSKVADLNTKMASSVAQLTEGFQTDNFAKIQSAYDAYTAHSKERTESINKTIEDAQKLIKEAQDKQQKVVDDVNEIAANAAKQGADSQTLSAISGAGSVSEALSAASGYLQTATGQLGDYLQYSRDTKQKGLTPLSYESWRIQDDKRQSQLKASEAYSTAYNSAAGKAAAEAKYGGAGNDTVNNLAQQLVSGNLAPSELSKRTTGSASYNAVLQAADQYSMATTGKHFSIAQADRDYKFAQRPQTQDTLNYLKSLTGTIDPNGNLTGGNLDELVALSDSIDRTQFPALNNAKKWTSISTGDPKYAQFQAVAVEVADQVAKILQGGSGGGGTSDAKLQQAANLFNTGFTKEQLSGVIDSLKPLLQNRAKAMISDNPYLSDYASDLGVETGIADPKDQVNTYISSHPNIAADVAKMYDIPGTTDQDILEYLNTLH